MTTSADREAIERWFVRRGVPQFIDDYRATTNVWTRAFPVLVVLFVVGIGTELGLESEFGAGWSALLVAGVVAAVVGLLVGVNRVLGRGLFERPEHVGLPELALFVVVPLTVAIVVERSVLGAIGTIAVGLAALGVGTSPRATGSFRSAASCSAGSLISCACSARSHRGPCRCCS